MSSPMFQKSGPYSGDAAANPPGSRKVAPTLVFRQNSSRPLLLNSQSVASNFKSAFAANKYTSYRLKHAPQTNTSAPSNTNKATTNHKAPEWTDAPTDTSFTPLAQYFTFTGRLNPVPEVKTNLENQNRNKVIEKFETNSYKLKLRSQEARGDYMVDEIGNEERQIFTHTNGNHHHTNDIFDDKAVNGTGEKYYGEERSSELREAACDMDLRRPHTEMSSRKKVVISTAAELENENGSLDVNNSDNRTFLVSAREEKRRPQSAAMSYALHKQEANTANQRPVMANGNGGNSFTPAAPPNPFLRGVPIPPRKENSVNISTGDAQTAPLSARQQNSGNTKNGQSSTFYNSSNSNRGVSVFNSKSILIQPRVQKNSSNPILSPDRAKLKSSLAVENSSDSASQPMSYLQRINSAKLVTESSHAKPKCSDMSLVSNQFDSVNTVNNNVKYFNNNGATSQDRSQFENSLTTSGSNIASNPHPLTGEQKANNTNNITRRSDYSNKPIQYVKPMIRAAPNSDTATEKGDSKGSESVQDENIVVVKVLKKSNSFGAQKTQNCNGDVKSGGKSVSEFSKIKGQDRSSSTENLAISNQNGDLAKTKTTDSSLTRAQKNSRVAKEKSKSVGQLVVSRKPAPAPPIPPRRPLCQLEQMHNNLKDSSVSNVAPLSEHQQKYPGVVRSSSRIGQTSNTKRSSFKQSQEDSFETVSSNKSNRLNRGSSVKANQHQRAQLQKQVSQAGDLMRNGSSYSHAGKSIRSSAPPNRSKQLSHSHGGTDSDYETGAGGEMSPTLDEDEEFDEYDDDGAEFVDDEMNSLEDDNGSMSTGRMSVCSSFSNLSMVDDDEEDEDDIDRDRNVHRSLSRVGSTSGLGVDQDGVLPALWSSLFNYIPPTIYFHLEDEKVAKLPHDVRKILKWKPSTICPNVVKKLIARVGFRFSKRTNDWICYWGKHMKSDCFKNVKEYQRVNHFPGTFQIGRKDRLYRNLTRLQSRHGQKHFNFFPNTFILPQDLRQFKRTWDEGGFKHKWILKPPASARGIGIRVINKWNQIPKRRAIIVQKYIAKPFLINGSKFDMRVYCFVSSYDPLRVYVYNNGLARFCSMKYSNSVKSIGNKFMHLTNYSVNKFNNEYLSNDSSVKCEGHKWTLQALWGWMSRRGIDYQKIWTSIEDIVVKTIMASEYCVSGLTRANVKNRRSCYELFGFDIILDEHLRPWILEVNISPSLHSNSELDVTVKESMLRDLFNILGLTIPDKEEVATSGIKFHHKTKFLEEGKFIRDAQPSPNERAKHVYFMQRASDENIKSTILDILTAEDLRLLTETEDEMNRAGDFIRVFPAVNTSFYLKFLDHPPKYNNLLLDEWVRRYAYMPNRGIAILEHLCNLRAHLGEREDLCKWAPTSGLNIFRPLIAGSGGANHNHHHSLAKSSRDHSTTRHGRKLKSKNGKQKALTAGGPLNRHTVGPITLTQTDEE